MNDTRGHSVSPWHALRTRREQGEHITNDELAALIALATDEPIPDDMRALIAERLRHGPPRRRRGRPASNESNRRAHLLRALILESMLHFYWARLGGRRGQRAKAAEQVAREAEMSVETLKRILSHEAPKARRAAELDLTLYWPLSEHALQALADARADKEKRDEKMP